MWNLDTFYVTEDVLVQALVPKVLDVSLCPKFSEQYFDMNIIYAVHLAYYIVGDVCERPKCSREVTGWTSSNNCFVLT